MHVGEQAPPLALRLGEKAPTGNSCYIQVEGRPAVYLISATAREVLDASSTICAIRRVTFAPGEVQEVHVAFDPLPPVVLQQQNNTWQLTAPVTARADEPQVRTLLQRLHDVQIQAFVAEGLSIWHRMDCTCPPSSYCDRWPRPRRAHVAAWHTGHRPPGCLC